MNKIIFDIEANGLLNDVTKIHCLSYYSFSTEKIISLTEYDHIINLFNTDNLIICGHNIIKYDIPVLEKILDIEISNKCIDTLGLSWYLFNTQKQHGLEYYGNKFNVPKPVISDWNNLSVQDYIHRCETDVKINLTLCEYLFKYLNLIYDNNQSDINRVTGYLNFKLDCLRKQEELCCCIDKDMVQTSLEELNTLQEEKVSVLKSKMPKVIKYKEVNKPKSLYKINGELSVAGAKWLKLLEDNNLDPKSETATVVDKEEEPNPNSTDQIKAWLFSLGWTPDTFKESERKDGSTVKVPQIYDENKEVCNSVKNLYSIQPELENLDSLSLIKHRIGVFKGFLSSLDSNNKVTASASGFTNTLRLKHLKPITNLVKVDKFYGDKIRGCIIAPDKNHLLCGSDMTALEDTTKQHYMYFFDPEYVTQMRVPGFDPHINIAEFAGLMTPEEAELYKTLKKKENKTEDEKNTFLHLNTLRNQAKQVNFSSVYGVGVPKLAKNLGCTEEFASKLHTAYWERNKAVKQVANNIKIKTVKFNNEEYTWCFNPVSKFWYNIRAVKDIFSTINQSTGKPKYAPLYSNI